MTCNIYLGWLLNGSLTAIEGPTNLRAEADVFVAPDAEQMRVTFLGNFWVAIEDWNPLRSVASWSVKTVICVCVAASLEFAYTGTCSILHTCFTVKQPLWGQTLFVWKEGGVSLHSVNTSKENISLLGAFLISWWTKAIKPDVVSWRIYINVICSGPGSAWHVH